jgi:hypothetical protein
MGGYSSKSRALAALLAGLVGGAAAGVPILWVGITLYAYASSGRACYDCYFALIFLGPTSMAICAGIGALLAVRSSRALGAILGMAVGSELVFQAQWQGWIRHTPEVLPFALAILACGAVGAALGWWLAAQLVARRQAPGANEINDPEAASSP